MTACFIDCVGRADYFGNLPNLAARVMALAAPGQVLLEGFQGFGPELLHKDELTALLPQQPSMVQGDNDYEAVEVVQLGKYPIKASVHYLALLFCSGLHGRYWKGKTVQPGLCTPTLCRNLHVTASAQGAADTDTQNMWPWTHLFERMHAAHMRRQTKTHSSLSHH